jgi:small subunit ribosomal protein S7
MLKMNEYVANESNVVFQSRLVDLLTMKLLKSGKKSIAQRLVYATLHVVKKKTSQNPLLVLEKAIRNIAPKVRVKSQGGSKRKTLADITPRQSINISLKWLITFAKARKGHGIVFKLANEIVDASYYRGESLRRKEQEHRMAKSNKSFSHFNY